MRLKSCGALPAPSPPAGKGDANGAQPRLLTTTRSLSKPCAVLSVQHDPVQGPSGSVTIALWTTRSTVWRDEVARQDEHSHVDSAVRERIAEVVLEVEHEPLERRPGESSGDYRTRSSPHSLPTGSTHRRRSSSATRPPKGQGESRAARASSAGSHAASHSAHLGTRRNALDRHVSSLNLRKRAAGRPVRASSPPARPPGGRSQTPAATL